LLPNIIIYNTFLFAIIRIFGDNTIYSLTALRQAQDRQDRQNGFGELLSGRGKESAVGGEVLDKE
jgi:hypothetical protein